MSAAPHYADDTVTVHHGDCIAILATLPDASVDAVVTDPPYGLEFMGKDWDAPWKASSVGRGVRVESERAVEMTERGKGHSTAGGPYLAARVDSVRVAGRPFQAWCELWAVECLRVLKPGGHLLAFGGTRTHHRLASAIEDAGFEIRDSICWLYGSGFPKSRNVSKDLADQGLRCRCPMGESTYGAQGVERRGNQNPVRPLRNDGETVTEPGEAPGSSVLLDQLPVDGPRADIDRESIRRDGQVGEASLRPGQSGMEGRRDAQAGEGQLHGSQVRPLPARVPGDGASGRLHHGAPAGDGSVGGPLSAADGSGEPQGPRPVEQHPGEPGAVSVERRPQAWGGWPVCERCSQPVIPDGLGTAAKPAHEPVVVARKPLVGTVAQNVLAHGTGALNVDACRVGMSGADRDATTRGGDYGPTTPGHVGFTETRMRAPINPAGRWPANVVLDESQAAALDQQSGERKASGVYTGDDSRHPGDWATDFNGGHRPASMFDDAGGASRFFYTAKADAAERIRIDGTAHPTVKPLALMRWLVRLVTPPGGLVLEPFAGSGTTVEACILEGFRCVAIEREADYLPMIVQRIHRRRDPVAAVLATGEDGGLFDLLDDGQGA
jgi:DNA modification methylase